MVARRKHSPNFVKVKKTQKLVSIMTVFTLLLSLLVAITISSTPVVIMGDSDGSWNDSFEDDSGIENSINISIENGMAFLGYSGTLNGTNWTKHGIAINNGTGGEYDSNFACHPWVIRDVELYKMWYCGFDGVNDRILYATSPDGLSWEKKGMVLNIGSPGEYDDVHASDPVVIKDGAIYKIWYDGRDGSNDRILYAFSFDGINWTKMGLALGLGAPGSLDDAGARPYTVLKEDNIYKMWYGGYDGSNWRMLYAESTDGVSWGRLGLVLDIGPDPLDDTHIGGSKVINDEGIYRLWYSGNDGLNYRIFYAISLDGKNWIKEGLALNMGSSGQSDDVTVAYPNVIREEEGGYKMWYQGSDGTNIRIHYATTPPRYNEGNITSVKIELPEGQAWNELIINKRAPGESNYLNITILDGETSEAIAGFENLIGTNIDISLLDYITHPTIKLHANFVGKAGSSPTLHEWTVTWKDTIPPSVPTGLTINNPFTGFSLILSWDSNLEQDLDSYVIFISPDNVTFTWLTNISAGPITFTDNGLTQGITYYYKIAAADEVPNQSPFSYVVEGVPDTDYDGDNIGDIDDPDDDNDGIPDFSDPYPLNPLNDIESTIDYMNTTIEDIQARVIIIQTILENLNFTEMLNTIRYLNQTLPLKIDDISNQLTGVNDSLMGRITDTETNILSELANVDASLSNEIQNLLVSITNDIIDMNASLSEELTNLLSTMTTEHNGLQQWLELVLGLIDTNLTTTNNTLHSQLDYLDQSITNFYNNLENDIEDVLSGLLMHDQNTGQNHSDIIGLLLDLLDGQIEQEQIDDLKTRLINLANDLSGHNQTIADDIMDVVNDIDAFENNINLQLININITLDQLARLQEILDDLSALDESLEQAEENIQDSVDERSTRDEDEEHFFMIELFLIILFILLIINMIVTILKGKQRKGEDGPPQAPENKIVQEKQQPPPLPLQISTGEGQNREVES